jgi:hypothetical protein
MITADAHSDWLNECIKSVFIVRNDRLHHYAVAVGRGGFAFDQHLAKI